MTKKDYREKIEESRQEIELDESKNTRVSRSKRGAAKRRSPLLTFLLVLFILIPLTILIYVKVIYKPEMPEQAADKVENDVVQVEQNTTPTVAADEKDDEEDKDADTKAADEAKAAEAAAAEKAAAEEAARKAAEEEAAAEAARKAAEEEAARKAAAEEAARKAAAEEAARKAAAEEAARKAAAEEEARKAEQQAAQPSGRTHTVKEKETLYRIAINYYGDPSAVEKIKRANGLSSESISAGQTLILP